MDPDFEVSVIIPVYNAEPFLRQSVESALKIDCVAEVVLIEDCSPDNALTVCRTLAGEYSRVKLFQHPNGENRGAGASRNLGILNARSEYIAFLDADDFYLPNRFEESKRIFEQDPTVDFTFGTVQYEKEFHKKSNNFKGLLVPRDNKRSLFYLRLSRKYGAFSTDGITIKRESLLKKKLFFNPVLRLHQDTELWLRILYSLKGRPETYGRVIALVRQHALNRITQQDDVSQLLLWETVSKEFKKKRLSMRERAYLTLQVNRFRRHSKYDFIDKNLKRIIVRVYKGLQSFERAE